MSFRDYLSEARSIFDRLYPDNKITEIDYEGSTIVVYTKDQNLFSQRDDLARQIAQELRRRIAIRPDPSIMSSEEDADAKIRSIIPENAGLQDIYFEPDTGEAVIEVDEPTIANPDIIKAINKKPGACAQGCTYGCRCRDNPL